MLNRLNNWKVYLLFSFVLGVCLRFLWIADMEYKADERYMFLATQSSDFDTAFPMLGMRSGAGFRNPGLSVWVFSTLVRLFGIHDPVTLTIIVGIIDVLAIALLCAIALRFIKKDEREPWLWAALFAPVNLFGVMIHRKIWAQSVLPLVSVVLLLSWWKRNKPLAAFFFGFFGSIIGQIHLSGLFYALALFLWSAISDVKNKERTCWRWVICGACIGVVPMIPWLLYLFRPEAVYVSGGFNPLAFFKYIYYLVTNSLGMEYGYSLGIRHLKVFFSYPQIFGYSTWLVALAHVLLSAFGIHLVVKVIGKTMSTGWGLKALFKNESFTLSAFYTGLLIYGLLISIFASGLPRHYLLVSFPLELVLLAFMVIKVYPILARRILITIWFLQLFLTLNFLHYIHKNHGADVGHYGVGYMYQIPGREY